MARCAPLMPLLPPALGGRRIAMAQKGSQFRAEANPALRTVCSNCGKTIPTEVGHPHPLDAEDRGVWKETWGLVGIENGGPKVFPTCNACYQAGWRPPGCLPCTEPGSRRAG